MAVTVVARAFLFVVKHLKGLRRLLEAFNGFLIARIFVRMKLDRQLAIRSRYLALRSSADNLALRSNRVVQP